MKIQPAPAGRLAAAEVATAHAAVRAWQRDRAADIRCPRCGAAGLVIVDRSARPHREWYALQCAACDLDAAIGVAMGPPTGT